MIVRCLGMADDNSNTNRGLCAAHRGVAYLAGVLVPQAAPGPRRATYTHGSYHAFVEVDANEAARRCGAAVSIRCPRRATTTTRGGTNETDRNYRPRARVALVLAASPALARGGGGHGGGLAGAAHAGVIELETDNASFAHNPGDQIARILLAVSRELKGGARYPNAAQWVRDDNGNRVGTWKYENHDEPRGRARGSPQ